MKSLNKYLTIAFILIANNIFAQLAKDSWSIGIGGTYPRLMSVWSKAYSGTQNYGAYISLKRNFSENVALRFLANHNYMEAFYDFPTGEIKESVTLTSASIDLLYYLVPCEPVSPYFALGFGGVYFTPENAYEKALNDNFLEYQLNLRVGVEWKISDNWDVTTELSYITPSTNKLDGENDTHEHKGIFGSDCDTYMTFNLGFLHYFSKGNPSEKCDLYSGLTIGAPNMSQLTLSDVEKIIKENLPKEIIKEVVVEKPISVPENRWVLAGVNFEFNSANLTQESFPFLLNALQVLTQHPDMQIEIRGHADNIGSKEFNLTLSERRAKVVRDYLVANGIKADRLDVRGLGESDPIANNKTLEGRTLNRRIEFKIKNSLTD
jgi:OmpA-OmpF porin, OOP family